MYFHEVITLPPVLKQLTVIWNEPTVLQTNSKLISNVVKFTKVVDILF